MILYWATFRTILDHMQPTDKWLDIPAKRFDWIGVSETVSFSSSDCPQIKEPPALDS